MTAHAGLDRSDPSKVGPYRIRGRLGAGGMGVVYAADDTQNRRPVAVKVVRKEFADDPAFRARFAREVAVMSRVHGPCLLPLLAADTQSAQPWLATPYAPGPTLAKHISMSGPLHGANLYGLAAGVAGALQAVHAAGIIHRDLKPSNVILTPAGPRVLDFGIAHALDETAITRTGMWSGTPGWTAPEQYKGISANSASDIFAWGALLAYAATGRQPFGVGAPDVVAWQIMEGEPDLEGLPGELMPHVVAALAKDPGDRPDAADLVSRLAPLLADQPTLAGHPPTLVDAPLEASVAAHWTASPADAPSWPTPPAPRARQMRTAVIAAAAAVVAIAGGIAGYTALHQSAARSDHTPPHKTSTKKSVVAAGGSPSSTPSASPSARATSWATEPAMSIDTAAAYTATIKLRQGTLAIKLDAQDAPRTVNSLKFLADQGYFNNTTCHRITTQGIYVLQCGDPTGTGSGGPGYTIPDENLKAASIAKGTYPAGTVAMANAGPNTNGSQFFLVYKDSALPPNYTPFGTMTTGLNVVRAIAAKGTANGSGDGTPRERVVIRSFTVTRQ
ncbi:protein kinase domain-containing protein [Streptomyces sp. HC307]|uniref:protein kinase domain-containing protein n=1 Tax=Streptomyces flavusporus TaxID=3385496 RepID=UPI0039175AD0